MGGAQRHCAGLCSWPPGLMTCAVSLRVGWGEGCIPGSPTLGTPPYPHALWGAGPHPTFAAKSHTRTLSPATSHLVPHLILQMNAQPQRQKPVKDPRTLPDQYGFTPLQVGPDAGVRGPGKRMAHTLLLQRTLLTNRSTRCSPALTFATTAGAPAHRITALPRLHQIVLAYRPPNRRTCDSIRAVPSTPVPAFASFSVLSCSWPRTWWGPPPGVTATPAAATPRRRRNTRSCCACWSPSHA